MESKIILRAHRSQKPSRASSRCSPKSPSPPGPSRPLSKKTPPFLIFHGDADTVVSIDQSRLFHAALEKAGVPNEFITLPGVGHSHVDIWSKERERILGFFAKHLKPAPAKD